ncbi:MAG: DUF1801 domain-containing protein [Bacteroidota bacterium]
MQNELTHFYLDQEEPLKSALLALRDIILAIDPGIQSTWKYSSPFFVYQGKNLCYLWYNKQTQHPYIGIIDGHRIEHPILQRGDRKQIKILSVNPEEDFPIDAIQEVLMEAMEFCAVRGKKS